MPDNEDYVRKFVYFMTEQGLAPDLTFDDAMRTKTREELGISSLNIILLIANYKKEYASAEMSFKPEWVARLNDVDGIISVMREIDESYFQEAVSE